MKRHCEHAGHIPTNWNALLYRMTLLYDVHNSNYLEDVVGFGRLYKQKANGAANGGVGCN